MAQKNIQTQTQQQVQTLSPQQVLLVRLLEMPVGELEQRVKSELMDNGALEERMTGPDEEGDFQDGEPGSESDMEGNLPEDFLNTEGGPPSAELAQALGDYSSADDVPDYLLRNFAQRNAPESMDYGDTTSFYEQMREQMGECELTKDEEVLMEYLIGSLESDGLLKKTLPMLVSELEVYHNIETTVEELERLLKRLQLFEPAGIGARSLQECLLLQIARDPGYPKSPLKQTEYQIIEKYYEDFTHKRWDRIQARLKLTDLEVEQLQHEIRRLTPRPGSAMGETVGRNFQQIIPDFLVEVEDDGTITMQLNQGDVPELRISDSFLEILQNLDGTDKTMGRSEREALLYTKQKVEKAQGFIEAIKQRRHTLMVTMQAIIELQRPFFTEGDEMLLRPMILKDVAERAGVDISTVSRVSHSKYVQTAYGIYPLKWFFSDGYTTEDGQEIATRRIQQALKELVEHEDPQAPMSDEALAEALKGKGFPIARRTVAKYREQLGIPVARMRR